MTRATRALATCILLSLWGCATTGLGTRPPSPGTQVGIASYYVSTKHGPRTASGTKYDDRALTAAHPTLPPSYTPPPAYTPATTYTYTPQTVDVGALTRAALAGVGSAPAPPNLVKLLGARA